MKHDLATEICAAIRRAVQKRKERGADVFEVFRFLDRLLRVWKSRIIREIIMTLAIFEILKTILELEGRHENQSHPKRT
ncbi:MAG: hypothetical protein BAA01_12280 [Bacillus thermozeamaize]|uniref:Uncharacterized protein n=1 Tax=Bacillus thermozeamaize TaxID=230954 RepID=A0A1Y3PUU0_9BACI|nr:MAG: hypothetical protein BAA01_12280 [Bacillus thermozeamaize]